MTGSSVYEQPFDTDKGYTRYHSGKFDILLAKIGIADEKLAQALDDFLATTRPQLSAANHGEDKGYATAYKDLENSLKLPNDYLEDVLSTR